MERAQSRRSSIAGQSRPRDLTRVAQLYLKLGDIQRHCNILVQLGQWERALALAPAVSLSYWSNLTKRYRCWYLAGDSIFDKNVQRDIMVGLERLTK